MVNENEHFRLVLLFYFRKGKNPVQARKKVVYTLWRRVEWAPVSELVFKHFKRLAFVSKFNTWVPYKLKKIYLVRRIIIISDSLLRREENDLFLKRIITRNDKWIVYNNFFLLAGHKVDFIAPCIKLHTCKIKNSHIDFWISIQFFFEERKYFL